MKNLILFFAIIGLLILNSCERTPDPPVFTKDYYQLKPGNSWVYEVQEIYNDTTIITRPGTDSVYVEKDTIINKYKYSKVTGKDWITLDRYSMFLRDSIGYLVDKNGLIMFSIVNSKDTLYAHSTLDIVRVAYKMDVHDSLVKVPAGSFKCLFYRGTITVSYPLMTVKTKTQGEFRAPGIGLITSNVVNAGEGNVRIRKNLIRYHLMVVD